MKLSTEELVAIAHAHAEAEAVDDLETTMATLDEDPVYELQPRGVAFRGRDAARVYDEYFYGTAKAMISGYVELLFGSALDLAKPTD